MNINNVIFINNEYMDTTEDGGTNLEPIIDLHLQSNNKTVEQKHM